VAQEPDTAGRWLRAYVRASFSEQPLPVELATLLFSAFVENPALRSFLQEDDARWQQRILSDGLSAPRATIVRQAADACWMDWLSGVDSVAPDDLRDELLSLAEAQP